MGDNWTATRESPQTETGYFYSHSSVDMDLNVETDRRLKPRPAHKFELWSAKCQCDDTAVTTKQKRDLFDARTARYLSYSKVKANGTLSINEPITVRG